jgi:surfactin synthase thioesterase subunit
VRGRVELPVKVVSGRSDPVVRPALLGDLERHAPASEVEIVDGGHFLVDQRPDLVADRARAWFG